MHAVVLRIVRCATLVFVAAAFLAQPVFANAGAGWIEDSRCCCPDTSRCTCGHEGDTQHVLTTCGNNAHLVAPTTTTTTLPGTGWELVVVAVAAPRCEAIAPLFEDLPPAELQRPG